MIENAQGLANLAALLRRRGMTIDEIAHACGISRRTAYRWIRILAGRGTRIMKTVRPAGADIFLAT